MPTAGASLSGKTPGQGGKNQRSVSHTSNRLHDSVPQTADRDLTGGTSKRKSPRVEGVSLEKCIPQVLNTPLEPFPSKE